MATNLPFLKLDNNSLQAETISLLRQINSLLATYGKGQEKYINFQQQLNRQIRSINAFEARMVIIAQMNAGKSTVINTIIGQDLLPTHDAAMTTIPTEVIVNENQLEPILKLSDQLLSTFETAIEKLKSRIEELGEKQAIDVVSSDHLNDQISRIYQGLSISASTLGRDPILETLRTLNHIVRLCNKLTPDFNPLEYLDDVPRIETRFWRSQETETLQKQGKLIIVDTPGHNEAGSSQLRQVVGNQLQWSSLVLAVLDYQHLDGEATAEIKQEIQKVLEIRPKENLYILVNKVDQRDEEQGRTTEEVRQFIANEFGIDNPAQIFEISARHAFYATRFLREIQDNPEASITELKTAKSLAKITLGTRWEYKLKKSDIQDLKDDANYIWKKSGFPLFLQQAIKVLMKESTHRCMRDALDMGNKCLAQLSHNLKSF